MAIIYNVYISKVVKLFQRIKSSSIMFHIKNIETATIIINLLKLISNLTQPMITNSNRMSLII